MLITEKSEKKMIGILLPPCINDYIILYSIAEGEPKTKVGEDILAAWYRNKIKTIPEEQLLEKVKRYVQRGWTASKNRGITIDDYKKQLERHLIKKGLSSEQITFISTIEI